MHTRLRDLRQAYLSTTGQRKTHLRATSRTANSQPIFLTDHDREEIDANAKKALRDLNRGISDLESAEQLRQSTEQAKLRKRFSHGLGVLGTWAAGGGVLGKSESPEQAAAEAAVLQMGAHRESVIWFLRQRLQEVAKTQQQMMETRLIREMEKSRSVLAKAWAPSVTGGHDVPDLTASTSLSGFPAGMPGLPGDDAGSKPISQDVTDEQMQMFEKGNQDMLRHYESTLDKVR